MHTIKMQYPSESSNPNFDGKVHTIVPINIKSVQIGKKDYYLLSYFDNSLLKSLVSILKKEGNTFIKIPLMDYDVLAREIRTKNIKPQRESLSLLETIENITCSNITNYEDLKEEKRTETMDEIVDIIKSNGNAITIKADGTIVATGYGKMSLTADQVFMLGSTYGIRVFDNRAQYAKAASGGNNNPPKNPTPVPPIVEKPILKMRMQAQAQDPYESMPKKNSDTEKTFVNYYDRCLPIPYDRIIGSRKFISYYSLAHYLRNSKMQKGFLQQLGYYWIECPVSIKADMNLNLIINKAIINHDVTSGCFLDDLYIGAPYFIVGAYENYYQNIVGVPSNVGGIETVLDGSVSAECSQPNDQKINIYRIKQSERQTTESYGFKPEENDYHVNKIDIRHNEDGTVFTTVHTGVMKLYIYENDGMLKLLGEYFDPGKGVVNYIEGSTYFEIPMSLNANKYPHNIKEVLNTCPSHELGIELDNTTTEDFLYDLLGIDIRQEKR